MTTSSLALQDAIIELPHSNWANTYSHDVDVVSALEQGKVIFLPNLAFKLNSKEKEMLSPSLIDPKRKNISYQPDLNKLSGVIRSSENDLHAATILAMMDRHYNSCLKLVANLLPEYRDSVHSPTSSLRLHPISEWKAGNSWRKDDTRLHVDAFPSRPNYGNRILRIFTNINPNGHSRVWRVGEPFPDIANHFVARCKPYSPFVSWLQNTVGITKTKRSHYDHIMLELHDAMKADMEYQANGRQAEIAFPTGSSWICFADQTPHAAMSGQFMMEQTFFLPIHAMKTPQHAPLKVLERLMQRPLI